MYWIIPVSTSLICGLINPYVGMFLAIFMFVELIVYFCMDRTVKRFYSVAAYRGDDDMRTHQNRIESAGKRLSFGWAVISVLFTVITAVVAIGAWALAGGTLTGDTTMVTPVDIFNDEVKYPASIILLILSIILNILAAVLVFVRRKRLADSSLAEKREMPVADALPGKDMQSALCINKGLFFGVLAVLFAAGFLDGGIRWFTFAAHGAYLLLFGITYLVFFTYKRMAQSNRPEVRLSGEYFMENIKRGKSYNNIMVAVAGLVAVIGIALDVILTFAFRDKPSSEIMASMDMVWLAVCVVGNIALTLIYTMSIRKL